MIDTEQKINSVFRDYATSSAFVITLSKNQTHALACVVESKKGYALNGSVIASLTRRGLIEIGGSKKERAIYLTNTKEKL